MREKAKGRLLRPPTPARITEMSGVGAGKARLRGKKLKVS